jgi:hypothetical protein
MIRTTQDTGLPEATDGERSLPALRSRSMVLGWAGLLAACAATAVLGVVTFGADDENDRGGRSPNPPIDAGVEPTGGDSGFVNPWEAGNAAVAQHLAELGRECVPEAPGAPAMR